MERFSRGLRIVAAINMSGAALCALAAGYIGSLIQIEPFPDHYEPVQAPALHPSRDEGQRPAPQMVVDESDARDLALPPLVSLGAGDQSASAYIAAVERSR